MIRLAVDAMGGDYAPAEIVAGAVQGARQLEVGLVLVGDPEAIQKELTGIPVDDLELEITPASDAIRMDEDPSLAVRSRAGASINVACRLVREGQADGVLTMGHTGAGMVAALFNFGRIPGVDRPAVIVPLLGLCEDLFVIDVGANAEVRPDHLLQFAQMGSVYAEYAGGVPNPRVGLLSNGSEPNKGNKVVREAYPLLAGEGRLNFIGNVEAHSLFNGGVNVVVADGFAGNVLLKASEGIAGALLGQVEQLVRQLPADTAAQVIPPLDALKARNHYATYGAAALLGVQSPMFIGHGRSKAQAVVGGMSTARRMIAADIVGRIRSVYT